MKKEKTQLLQEIEKLLSFDANPVTINSDYLAYFTVAQLQNIRDELQRKIDRMVEEERQWLRQFRKSP